MPKNGVPTFVKWAGGKTQLLEQFKPFFPKKISRYLEPFVGSGAVFFYIKQKYDPKEVILSDNNEELINCYIRVRDNLEELMGNLKNHEDNFLQFSDQEKEKRQNYYYSVRSEDSTKLDGAERAARFIFLNRTCFNGLYRVNPRGQFNVPMGKYKNPSILREKDLIMANKLLQSVELKVRPFEGVLHDARKGDFVYIDPPYYPLNRTSNFTSYTKEVFLEKEQKQLVQVFKKLNEKGCKVMLSNSDTPFINSLYNHGTYTIKRVKARRAINSDAEKRGEINELLVMNY
jgi:DNA adenine methylase